MTATETATTTKLIELHHTTTEWWTTNIHGPKEVLRTSYSIFKSRIDSAEKAKATTTTPPPKQKKIKENSSKNQFKAIRRWRECLFNRFCEPERNLFHVSIHSITVSERPNAVLKEYLHFCIAIKVKMHKHTHKKKNEMKRRILFRVSRNGFSREILFFVKSVFHPIVKFL